MTKVFNINLGGMPFTIDEDAYEQLSSYLKTIHNHFRSSEGYEEITTDIEARMAELFQEKLGGRPIVSLKDVQGVIAIMGTPEDFGAEPMEDVSETPKAGSSTGKKFGMRTGKRLFKNPEDEVIGGVCSGIAAYFGIADPLWVRLAFVVFAFTGGFTIPLYFILWAILPKAESASDRLAMRGEPINASNIGKIIEEEFEHVSRKVGELGDELKSEFGSKKKSGGSQPEGSFSARASNTSQQFRSAASEGLHVLGRVIRTIIETILKIVRPIGFIIGVFLVVMLVLAWVFSVGGLFMGMPFGSFLLPGSSGFATLGAVNVLIFIGVPLLMLVLAVMRLFMRSHFKPRWTVGLWIFWALNLVSLIFVTTRTVKDFGHGSEVSLGANTFPTQGDTLFIDFEENPHTESILHFGPELTISDGKLISENIRLRVERSESGKLEIIQSHYSRGEELTEAQQLAGQIPFNYRMDGNRLTLPSVFEIDKSQKWRGQSVNLTVKMPEGMWLKQGKNFKWNHFEPTIDENYAFPWWESNYSLKMGPNGLYNEAYSKQKEAENQELSFSNFSKVHVDADVFLNIRQSGEYSINFTEGGNHASENVEVSQQGDQLFIYSPENLEGKVTLEITLPNITELQLMRSDKVTLTELDLGSFRFVNHGEGRAEVKGNFNNLEVELSGDNSLDLSGNCNRITASLDGDARLDASQLSVRVADMTAINDSWVKISPADTLYQHVDEGSNLVSKLKTSVVVER